MNKLQRNQNVYYEESKKWGCTFYSDRKPWPAGMLTFLSILMFATGAFFFLQDPEFGWMLTLFFAPIGGILLLVKKALLKAHNAFLKEVEKQIALSAAPCASNYLDEITAFGGDNFICEFCALNFHVFSRVLYFVSSDKKFNMTTLYHFVRMAAIAVCGKIGKGTGGLNFMDDDKKFNMKLLPHRNSRRAVFCRTAGGVAHRVSVRKAA